MKKSMFKRFPGKRIAAVAISLAMFVSVFATMGIMSSAATIETPTVLTADKWSSDARLSVVNPEKGAVKIANAATYTDPIWPVAEAKVTVNLDKLPYLCVQTNDLNTPYSLFVRVDGGANVYVLNNQYGGSEKTGTQSYNLKETLGASGTQTVVVGVHWLTGSADYAATEIGQRYITFSDFIISDKADDFTAEPVVLTADKWGSDARLSVVNPEKGAVKIANAATYTDAIWPAAEAKVTVNLDKLPYLCVQTNDLNTPYSLYVRVDGGANVYVLNNQYGGSEKTGAQSYNLKEALGASGTQTVVVGVHWLTGSADYAATEIGQRYITFSDFIISDKADDFAPVLNLDFALIDAQIADAANKDESIYTADSWATMKAAWDAAVAAKSNATTQKELDDAALALQNAIASLEEEVILVFTEIVAQITNAESRNESIYTADSWATMKAAWDAAVAAKSNATTQKELDDAALALKNALATLVEFNYTAIDAQIADAGTKNQSEYTKETWNAMKVAWDAAVAAKSNATTQKELDDAALALQNAIAGLEELVALVNPIDLTTDLWSSDTRLKISNLDGGVISVTNTTTYDSAIWPIAGAELTVDLDKLPYLVYEVGRANTPYTVFVTSGDKTVYLAGNQYGGVVGKTAGAYDLKEKLGLSGVQTITVSLYWLSGDNFATEAGQYQVDFSAFAVTNQAGKEAFDARNTIVSGYKIPMEDFMYDPSRVTVTPGDDGYSFTTAIPGTAVVPFAEISKKFTIDLDKVPYLYVDIADMQTSWKVKFGTEDGKVVSGDPGLSENNLPIGANGLHRFDIARATGLSGVQDITIMLYTVDGDYQMTAGSVNSFNALYFDDADFDFEAPQAIDSPTILDPNDFRYTKSMLNLLVDGVGCEFSIIPPAYPSWQTAGMGLRVDFDKIKYLCLNIPECKGDIEITISDVANNESYTIAKYKKSYNGTLIVDLEEKVGWTGVKTVCLGVTYNDGTYKNKMTVDNIYLTTEDLATPEGITNLEQPSDGDDTNQDGNGDSDQDENNDSNQGENDDNKTPETGVAGVTLLALMFAFAVLGVVLFRKRARN